MHRLKVLGDLWMQAVLRIADDVADKAGRTAITLDDIEKAVPIVQDEQ